MKKTRLLEIIREEISYALKENYSTTEASCGSSVKEDQLDEMAKITEPIGDALRMAVERIQSQDSSLTADQITKLVRNKKSQELVAPELKAALEKDFEEKGGEEKYTPGLGYPQTLKAVEKIIGKAKVEPTEEIPTDTTDVEDITTDVKDINVDMDDDSKSAMQNIGSDETAKKLGKIAYSKKLTPEEEKQFQTALKGINAKIKRIEDGEEKPNDRTLLKTAYQNPEIKRLFNAKGLNLNDILKGIIG